MATDSWSWRLRTRYLKQQLLEWIDSFPSLKSLIKQINLLWKNRFFAVELNIGVESCSLGIDNGSWYNNYACNSNHLVGWKNQAWFALIKHCHLTFDSHKILLKSIQFLRSSCVIVVWAPECTNTQQFSLSSLLISSLNCSLIFFFLVTLSLTNQFHNKESNEAASNYAPIVLCKVFRTHKKFRHL